MAAQELEQQISDVLCKPESSDTFFAKEKDEEDGRGESERETPTIEAVLGADIVILRTEIQSRSDQVLERTGVVFQDLL